MMQLSLKAVRFIIDTLEHYHASQEERLRDESLPEEESSGLVNDCQYLEAIKTDMHKYHDELMSNFSSHSKVSEQRISP